MSSFEMLLLFDVILRNLASFRCHLMELWLFLMSCYEVRGREGAWLSGRSYSCNENCRFSNQTLSFASGCSLPMSPPPALSPPVRTAALGTKHSDSSVAPAESARRSLIIQRWIWVYVLLPCMNEIAAASLSLCLCALPTRDHRGAQWSFGRESITLVQ